MKMNYKKIIALLKEYNYFITENDWVKSTKDHPDFPQLNAINDIFNQYGIDSYLAQVPFDLWDDLPDNFMGIVHYKNQLETTIINKLENHQVNLTFFDSSSIVDLNEFFSIWNGYILVIEENENTPIVPQSTKATPSNYSNYFILFFLLLAISCLNSYYSFISLESSFLLITSGIGLVLSLVAVRESLGFGNRYLFKVCSTIKNGNCNQVIRSSNAVLIAGITYSDLSLAYFLGTFSISFFTKHFPSFLAVYAFILPVALIMVANAIYQQRFVLKKWCLLCLVIGATVVIQYLIFISIYGFSFTVNHYYTLSILTIMLFWLFIWNAIKPQFSNLSELIFEKYQRGEIYKDKEVFNLYLQKNIVIPEAEFKNLKALTLNTVNTPHTLTLILSPTCDYCKYEYLKFKEVLFYYQNKINFRVIFDFDPTEVEENVIQIVENCYAYIDDTHKSNQALDDFLIENYSNNKWLKKWKVNKLPVSSFTASNRLILTQNNITDTPCLLINNRLFPREYKMEDIKYFLNNIVKNEQL